MFDDGHFIALKRLFSRSELTALFVNQKVGGEPAPPQLIHRFRHGIEDMSSHIYSSSSARKEIADILISILLSVPKTENKEIAPGPNSSVLCSNL